MKIKIPDREKRDKFFFEAAYHVVETNEVRPSKLQMKFKIGYMRANNIVEQLLKAGIVTGDFNNRKVNVTLDELSPVYKKTLRNEFLKDIGL